MKKRSLLSLWFAAAATLAGMSAPVSPGQAVGIASDFLNSSTRNDLRRASGGKLSVCYTHADRLTGTNTLYAVSLGRQGGYVLVSADDAAPAVIGYSERGAFDSAAKSRTFNGAEEVSFKTQSTSSAVSASGIRTSWLTMNVLP